MFPNIYLEVVKASTFNSNGFFMAEGETKQTEFQCPTAPFWILNPNEARGPIDTNRTSCDKRATCANDKSPLPGKATLFWTFMNPWGNGLLHIVAPMGAWPFRRDTRKLFAVFHTKGVTEINLLYMYTYWGFLLGLIWIIAQPCPLSSQNTDVLGLMFIIKHVANILSFLLYSLNILASTAVAPPFHSFKVICL